MALGITCIRNEGPWLLDWIAHHQAAGFDHFLIASHDCTDGTDTLLDALAETGLVTHVPFTPKVQKNAQKAVQWQALKLLEQHPTYINAETAMFFDVDEYIVLERGTSLADLLPEDADAVPLRWHMFGNSGHSIWQDLPVTERFTRAAPEQLHLPLAQMFKTLHRPSAFGKLGVHRPKGKGARWMSSGGTSLTPELSDKQALIHLYGVPSTGERAWLNHYSVRSIEEFVLKSQRGLPNHTSKAIDTGYWALRNFNTVEDLRIAPMLDAAKASRSALAFCDPLHAESLAHHRSALRALKNKRHVVDLMWQLEMLTSSTPPNISQLSAHAKRLAKANSEDKNG
jgi:hypothetical protein